MLYITFKYTLYSILIILIFHYIYDFLKNTLTTPKTIDLVNKPNNIYRDIYKTLNNPSNSNTNPNNSNINSNNLNANDESTENTINMKMTNINDMNSIDKMKNENFNFNMKEELKNFFDNLKSNEYNNTNDKLNYSDYSVL